MPPDAHAASWRAAGTPHSAGSTVAGMPPELALPVEQLAERVADVDGLDLARLDLGVGERAGHDVGDEVADLEALLGVVAGEVGLEAAQDEDRVGHRAILPDRTRERVTWTRSEC